MAARMIRFCRTFHRAQSTILRSSDRHFDGNNYKNVLLLRQLQTTSSLRSLTDYDDDEDEPPRHRHRQRHQREQSDSFGRSFGDGRPFGDGRRIAVDIQDEYTEHHLSEKTVSKLGELTRQHREEALNEHVGDDSKKFSDFPLDPTLIKKLDELGYKTPFAIQSKTLEYTLNSRDVIGRAVTGSGKTLAFAIPVVNKIRESNEGNVASRRKPRAIVLSPTRELCNQIYRSVQELDSSVRCVALYGGASYQLQERELNRGVDVICATPGRLNDHIKRGNIDVKHLLFLCLDEADEMLTQNFREQIHNIFEDSPKNKQVLMFSATMPFEVKEIAQRYLKNPAIVDITDGKKNKAPESIVHRCMRAPASLHASIVANLVAENEAQRCIVFLNTKVRTNGFAEALKRHGLQAEAINSDLSQNRRESILSAFRLGDLKILCATDVAARGLDIPETDLVVQVGPPDKGLEFYIHRSGRTGRAGRKGLSVLLHSGFSSETDIINQISRVIQFEHISAPEKLSESLRENSLKLALQNLNKVSQKDIGTFLPAAQKLFEQEGKDKTELMAAALSLLCISTVNVQQIPSSTFPPNQSGTARTSQRFSSNFDSNRYNNRQPFPNQRRRPQLKDWDEDDEEVDVRRFR